VTMQCYPAIDIRGGRCVRLVQGVFADETVFGDPVEVAVGYVEAGAAWLHVVDLDAALTGEPVNREVVLAIASAVEAKVQVGGGVRDAETAAALLDAGIARIVLGTVAVEQPRLAGELARRYPGRVAVGIDHRRAADGTRVVVVRGWTGASGVDVSRMVKDLEDNPIGAVVVTDVHRDGTMTGPDLRGLEEVLAATTLPVLASGGVAGVDDLRRLAALRVDGRGLAGVVVGRALLSGAMTIEEALAACGP
jgi:phosphoribosylformimino-5-aminoimidazole carboxamide ribotide isomerase